MAAYSCLFGTPFPWLAAALVSFLAFAHSSGFGFLTVFLTSSALILCPVIISRSKSCHQKSILKKESPRPVIQEVPTSPESESEKAASCQNQKENAAQMQNEQVVSKIIEKEESIPEKDARISDKKEDKKGGDYSLLSSSDALSDSESLDHTTSSEDSENDWIFRENLLSQSQSTPCSDGSISDEESLIEIALPAGHYVESKRQDQSCCGFQQKWPDFRQQNWMEMLNEMNEEENLIEIDICMGCIKFSRFEIQA